MIESNAMLLSIGFLTVAAGCGGAASSAEDVGSTSSALSTTYQAENAFDIDEGVIETVNPGWTGTGYVNIDNAVGTQIWNIVSSLAAGSAALRIRYANGTGANRPIQVVVNGTNGPLLSGAPTGSWSNWANTSPTTINLLAGNNDLVFVSTTSTGMPNIDSFTVNQSFTRTVQAENAFDLEEGVIETIHPGFTGTGYVNIDNAVGTFIWHVIDSPATVAVSMRIRYANGTTLSRPIQIVVNGANGPQVAGAPTGSWNTWTTAPAVTISLAAGSNDVLLESVTSDGLPNIDKYDLTF